MCVERVQYDIDKQELWHAWWPNNTISDNNDGWWTAFKSSSSCIATHRHHFVFGSFSPSSFSLFFSLTLSFLSRLVFFLQKEVRNERNRPGSLVPQPPTCVCVRGGSKIILAERRHQEFHCRLILASPSVLPSTFLSLLSSHNFNIGHHHYRSVHPPPSTSSLSLDVPPYPSTSPHSLP